ncbi:gp6 protein [Mycobacteroides abscessus subsp. abscessus]|uniref:hypothetical protein n=1 Tax=Mycobacteroides abscessus TaxID=36809 RepID=UPI00092AA0A8|nr:hypothetical protein [Mycobacteroides abscessus]SHT83171.1 gp6 protein [Mycobacteroides abscessus subsp. abscessus]SKO52610.1 gp6 protein [Mycobacteroides abscessus subsp. abscessus]
MVRVIGIDSSLTGTGLVRVDWKDTGWTAKTHLTTTKPKDGSHAYTSYRIKTIMAPIVTELEMLPSLIVLEAPALAKVGGHNHDRSWLWGKIFDACMDRRIPIITPTPNQRAQYATGAGNAGKDVVLAASIRRWPQVDIVDNNIADAMVLAAIGCRVLGHPIDSVTPDHYISKSGKSKGNWIERMAA